MNLTPTGAALLGSVATAIAIFGGGLAVEAYKRARDRAGMALALAGAIDALIGLIEARKMTEELGRALVELEAGRPFEFASLIDENAPFKTITLTFAHQIGNLGGELPFRVARFLTYNQGLQQDLARLAGNQDRPAVQATLIRSMHPLWTTTRELGLSLVADLKRAGLRSAARGLGPQPHRAAKRIDAAKPRP